MPNKVLKLDPQDNVLIALSDLRKGEQILFASQTFTLESDVPAKHKFATEDLAPACSPLRIPVIKPHPFTKKPLTSAGPHPTSPAGANANSSDTAAPTGKS